MTILGRTAAAVRHPMQALSNMHKALVGRRLNPQKPQSPPYFEGWYSRVTSPTHSFGIVTGYFPDQAPKHSAAYTAILVNHDKQQSQLQSFESYLPKGQAPALNIQRGDTQGEQETDFLFQHPGGIINIQGKHTDLTYEANTGGAQVMFKSLSGSTPWSDDGGGSPQGLLHLLPGLGLHWYVHSTLTRVAYDVKLPDGQELIGEGWAHVEKNWGGSFPRSFVWSQGFASAAPCNNNNNGSSNGSNGSNGYSSNGRNGYSSNGSNGHSSNGSSNGGSEAGSSRSSTSSSNVTALGAGSNNIQAAAGDDQPQATFCLAGGVLPTLNLDKLSVPLPDTLLMGYRSAKLNWHFTPQSLTLFTNTIKPEEGLIIIKAQQLNRSITLRVQAPLETFSRVGGPTRGGFVPHSVESYSATATAECYQDGQLIEVSHFDRSALEFGGSYACRAEEGAGRDTEGLVCEPQWEE